MMNDLAHSTFYRQFPLALLILGSFTLQLGAQQQLTLEEALDQARNNPAYQAQEQQIQVLEAQLQQADRRPNPQFEADYETEALSGNAGTQELSLLLVQTWERGGKRQLRRQIAQTRLEQAVLEAENYLRVLTSEIRLAYLELLWSQKRSSLTESHSERINNLLQLDLVRVEQGEIPTLNTDQLQTELTTLEAQKGQLETERWRTQYEFNVLIGSEAEAEYRVVEEETDAIELPDTDQALRFALANRPDLSALRTRVTRADLEVSMEEAVAKRDWDLGVGYHLTRGDLTADDFVPRGILQSADSATNSFHLTLSVPLALWDDNSGNIASRLAARGVRERELVQAESRVRSQVLSAFRAHRLNQRSRELYQNTLVPRLAENGQRLEAAYQLTGENLGEWIGIQQDFLEAALQGLEADFQARRSVIKLIEAVGGSLVEVTQRPPSGDVF
jgi:cobalt-zinc-cadmium efflux system outer membrane protein